MDNKVPIVATFPLLLLLFLVFGGLFMMSGGSLSLPPLATEAKTLEYAEISSKLGVPWDLVMLVDAIKANAEGKEAIVENPILANLDFLRLTEHQQILDGDEKWTYGETKIYEGRKAILGYIGLTESDISPNEPPEESPESHNTEIEDEDIEVSETKEIENEIKESDVLDYQENKVVGNRIKTPEELLMKIRETAANKSTDQIRYTAILSLNPDYKKIMRDMGLSEEEIKNILELHDAQYLLEANPDIKDQIVNIIAKNGVYQKDTDSVALTPPDYSEGLNGEKTFTDGSVPVVYYRQTDQRWRKDPYGTDTIGDSGCGPTSMAMIITSLTGKTIDPIQMCDWAYKNGYYAQGAGTYGTLMPMAAKEWGLTIEDADSKDKEKVIKALRNKKLIVAIMGPGNFTKKGHYIVLRGVTDNDKILVADSNSYERSQKEWDFELIASQLQGSSAAGGPLWIIGNENIDNTEANKEQDKQGQIAAVTQGNHVVQTAAGTHKIIVKKEW